MIKYRGGPLIRAGFIGVVLILLVIAVGLQPQQLWSLASSIRYQALFSEAGGLAKGNAVTVSGIKVGTVSDISLKNGEALVTFNVPGTITLGSDTTAHIRTGRCWASGCSPWNPQAARNSARWTSSPISRTSSPYSLTEAVSDLTTNSADTNSRASTSPDTLSATLDQIAPQLGPAFDGLTRLSKSLNSATRICAICSRAQPMSRASCRSAVSRSTR